MHEEEIIKLYKKIQELKSNYEIAKQNRINLVNNIEDLDKKISELEEELKHARLNNKDNFIDNFNTSKFIKKCLIRTILAFLVTIIITAGIDLFIFKNLSLLANQWLTSLFINVTFSMSPAVVVKVMAAQNEKKTNRVEKIEREYTETLQKRISEGQRYKKIREEETLAEKIYKGTEKVLTEQIAYMETTGQTKSSNYEVDTSDIYSTIKLDSSFIHEPIEEKRKILDEELRRYLANKVSQSYYNAIKPENLESFTAEELVKMLSKQIPHLKHNETLGHIIHAVLGFAGTMQECSVLWFEEDDEALINSPAIIFDEQEKWSELKTHKNTNYEMLFNVVYDTFINKVMKTSKHKTKVKENN